MYRDTKSFYTPKPPEQQPPEGTNPDPQPPIKPIPEVFTRYPAFSTFEIGYNGNNLLRMNSLFQMPLMISAAGIGILSDIHNAMKNISSVRTSIQRNVADLYPYRRRKSHLTFPVFQHRIHTVSRNREFYCAAGCQNLLYQR